MSDDIHDNDALIVHKEKKDLTTGKRYIKIDVIDLDLFSETHYATIVKVLQKNKGIDSIFFNLVFNSCNIDKNKFLKRLLTAGYSTSDMNSILNEKFMIFVICLDVNWELENEYEMAKELFLGAVEFTHTVVLHH